MVPAPQLRQYVTIADAADGLHCSRDTVRREIARGNLPAKRFGRRILIDRRDLERALKPVTNFAPSGRVAAQTDHTAELIGEAPTATRGGRDD